MIYAAMVSKHMLGQAVTRTVPTVMLILVQCPVFLTQTDGQPKMFADYTEKICRPMTDRKTSPAHYLFVQADQEHRDNVSILSRCSRASPERIKLT